MRIALFTDTYTPHLSGVSFAVQWLASDLWELGHEAYVFAPTFNKHQKKEKNIIRFPSIHPPAMPYKFPFAVPGSQSISKAFDALNIDIIHTHTPFMVGLVGRNYGRHENIPVVSTYHTLYEEYVHYVPVLPQWWLKSWLSAYLRYYYNGCDALVTVSNAAKNSLLEYKIKHNPTIIPTGLPFRPALDKSEERKRIGIPEDHHLLLFVGRIAPEKNIPLLIRMMLKVTDSHPNTTLVIVGDGPFLEEGIKISEMMGMQNNIKFVGLVPRDEVSRYYCAADVFVFSSHTETQGLVIGEAQSYGLPCVTVEGGGAAESVEANQTGFIVPRDDDKSFASAVIKLLDSATLYTDFSAAALRKWGTKGTIETTKKILELYQSLLKK